MAAIGAVFDFITEVDKHDLPVGEEVLHEFYHHKAGSGAAGLAGLDIVVPVVLFFEGVKEIFGDPAVTENKAVFAEIHICAVAIVAAAAVAELLLHLVLLVIGGSCRLVEEDQNIIRACLEPLLFRVADIAKDQDAAAVQFTFDAL